MIITNCPWLILRDDTLIRHIPSHIFNWHLHLFLTPAPQPCEPQENLISPSRELLTPQFLQLGKLQLNSGQSKQNESWRRFTSFIWAFFCRLGRRYGETELDLLCDTELPLPLCDSVPSQSVLSFKMPRVDMTILISCNTNTAAFMKELRENFPEKNPPSAR